MTDLNKRDGFDSKMGFILASIGSSVGMGNIWLFPYRTGQLGGAAFLIPYFIFVVLIGYIGIVEEMSFGRGMRTGPLGAFRKATESKGSNIGRYLGWIPVIGSMGIAIGYSVVVGWIIRFTVGSITGAAVNAPDHGAYFGQIAGPYGSIVWHLIAIVLTFAIMSFGIAKGIEKINKVMMPLFFVMFIVLAIRVVFLEGSGAGYEYLFKPDWSKLAVPSTWVFALGQAFFSLSLAGSGSVVYGSYLSDTEDITSSAKIIALFDTIAAMLAALVIIPAVFAYGVEPTAGPPLLFLTMPQVFGEMPGGQLFAIIFFIAVLFAGVTSLVNLYETPVEALQNRLGFSRKKAVITIAIIGFAIGIFIENGDVLGAWMDMVSIYIIPLGALLSAFMFFWFTSKEFQKTEISKGRPTPVGDGFVNYGKYVFCGVTLVVYILGVMYGGIG